MKPRNLFNLFTAFGLGLFLGALLIGLPMMVRAAGVPPTSHGEAQMIDNHRLTPASHVMIQATLGTTFTYQGRLLNRNTGQYLDGLTCDFQFDLYAVPSGGAPLAGTVTQLKTGVTMTNGYFTVDLDFGNVFDGNKRYLEVAVQCPPDTSFTTLSGRIELNAAPYALHARSAQNAGNVDWTDIINVPIDLADGDNELDGFSCSANQTLKHDGTGWQCENILNSHSALLDLTQDDHPQYLRTDGTRALTGNWNVGSRKITNLAAATVAGDAVRFEQAVKNGDTAGGDLGGTYPDPTVVGLYGRPVTNTMPSTGQVLGWQGGVRWAPITVLKPGDASGGDLSGTYPDPTVAQIQGRLVAATAPSNGQILKWDGTANQWTPSNTSVAAHDHFGQTWTGSATAGLRVENSNSTADSAGFFGVTTATTGRTYGVRGRSDSQQGRGVYGQATANFDTNYGVYGEVDSTSNPSASYGVYGKANTAAAFGGYFVNANGGACEPKGQYTIEVLAQERIYCWTVQMVTLPGLAVQDLISIFTAMTRLKFTSMRMRVMKTLLFRSTPIQMGPGLINEFSELTTMATSTPIVDITAARILLAAFSVVASQKMISIMDPVW